MVYKKINYKWSWWHGKPNIKKRYKAIGGCTSEQKTFKKLNKNNKNMRCHKQKSSLWYGNT
jgi:hypothetical protein